MKHILQVRSILVMHTTGRAFQNKLDNRRNVRIGRLDQ